MSTPEQRAQFTQLCQCAANGNALAEDFIARWLDYFAGIEQLVASGTQVPEEFIKVLAETNMVYSHAYYGLHSETLCLSVQKMLSDLADSWAWCGQQGWKREASDCLFHAGSGMVLQVALLEGGYPLLREISPRLQEVVRDCHVDNRPGKA